MNMPGNYSHPKRDAERPVVKGWLAAIPIVVFLVVFATIAFGMAWFAYSNGAPWIFVLGAGGIGVIGICFCATGAYAAYLGKRGGDVPGSEAGSDGMSPPRVGGSPSSRCAYCGRAVPADQIACPGCGSALER